MTIDLDETGLVIAMVEEVQGTLKSEVCRVMDSGVLNDDRCGRLARALRELETALEEIKREPGVAGSVRAVRNGPDGLAGDMVDQVLHPGMLF